MPRSAAKSRVAQPVEGELLLRTLSDLLEDTVLLAAEEGAATECASFTEYISAALPPDMLESLAELMGGDGGDESEGGIGWFLQEIWAERFAPNDSSESCADMDAPRDCQVCERRVTLTRHHLFPREMHKFCLKRGVATAEELERRVLHCCRLCHNAIHRFFSNEELALRYHSLELLLEDDKFFRFARWNAAQPAGRNGKCR
jgi:hypothetical protein